MAALDEHFADYADHHRSLGNKATHIVGIPIIAFALLGLASKVLVLPLPSGARSADLGVVLALVLVLVYARWHIGLALGFGLLLVPLYLAGTQLAASTLWASIAAGVAVQYVGHLAFEKNQPAFHRNAVHMLVGPLFIASLLLRHVGLYRPRYEMS